MPRSRWSAPDIPTDRFTRVAPERRPGQASAICSEDLVGLSFEGLPREIRIDSLFGQPVASLNLDSIPFQALADIERAAKDLGRRFGVISARVESKYARGERGQNIATLTIHLSYK